MQLQQKKYTPCDFLNIDIDIKPLTSTESQWELYLSLDFEEAQIKVLTGEIKFALRSAQIHLEVEQGEFKIDKSAHNIINPLKNAFSNQPQWQIRHQPPTQFLQGQQQIKLGTIYTTSDKTPLISLTITTKPLDLILTNITGIWHPKLSPNKQAILDRILAQHIQKTTFNTYVSKIIGTIENKSTSNPSTNNTNTSNPTNSSQYEEEIDLALKNSIENISTTSIDNLKELAQIVGLNPLSDFAGGNFLGANLSNLNLSSANLQSINLRGADLTDTDLSEANLSYASLNGADLSGAYLEGANLSYAKLNSSSLALANLIGVNLTNADLSKANLQNTTFAQAQLQGAIFSENDGTTLEKQKEWEQQGGIFQKK